MYKIQHIPIARPLLTIIATGVLLFGCFISGMGTALVRFGSKNMTDIHFVGHSFQSADVGIAAIFLGAAIVVLVLGRLLKRLKELGAVQ